MNTISTIKFPGDTVAREIVDKVARTNIGELTNLSTAEQSNLVAAINELKTIITNNSAKAVFIDLSATTCQYTLEQITNFINDSQIVIGKAQGLYLSLIDINSDRAVFIALTDELFDFITLFKYKVFADQSIGHEWVTLPKISVPQAEDKGKYLVALEDGQVDWISLNIGNETTPGLVAPLSSTEEMTNPVGIDEYGHLWVASTKVEIDSSLTQENMAADAAAVGNALADLQKNKVTNINLTNWDSGDFTTTLSNGMILNFKVTFDENNLPIAIQDEQGVITNITWN